MILLEFYKTRTDGVNLWRSYSDLGVMIERDGELYEEAIDPEGSGRVYTETDIPIVVEEPEEESENEDEFENEEDAELVAE